MSDLPNGWSQKFLGQVLSFNYGKSLPERVRQGGDIPVYGSNGAVGTHNASLIDGPSIIIGRKGSVGEVHFSNGPCWPIDTTYFVNDFGDHSPIFWFWYLKYLNLDSLDRATTIPGLNRGDAYALNVAIPPPDEQRRIVAKLDSLLARSRRAREELAHIPRLVERTKQGILADVAVDENGNEWPRVPLGTLIREGPTNGYSPRTGENPEGTLSLKLSATTKGSLNLSDQSVKRLNELISPSSKFWLKPGDILIQRANSLAYVGATAIFEGPEQTYIYPDLMMRIRVASPVLGRWIWHYLNSAPSRQYFMNNATGTAGNMPKINGQTVRNISIPMPPFKSLEGCLEKLESRLQSIDALAAEAARATALLDRLDQATLAKAFRGELLAAEIAEYHE